MRRCASCREVREDFASPQARRCDSCKAAGGPPRPCSRCKEIRPADQFVWRGHVCESCREERLPPRACLRCHEVKPASAFPVGARSKEGKRRELQRGQKSTRHSGVCQACWDEEAQAKEARKVKEWEQDGRMVRQCSKCEVRDFPEGFYASRRRADGSVVYDTQCKECAKKRGEASRKARLADPARREKHRAKRAALERARRAKNRERIREINRRYRQRMKADPARHAAHREATRIQYRLRQERAGHDLSVIRGPRSSRLPEPDGGRVPVGPLIEAVEDWMARNQKDIEEMCAMVEIDSKSWRRWKSGESLNTDLRVADAILTVIGAHWWDVWTEPEDRAKAEELWEGPIRTRTVPLGPTDEWPEGRPVPDVLGEYEAKRKARRAERQAA